jgi:putative membrane protein
MMAWLRTATALIGFGFTIVQFFEHLQQIPGARHAYAPHEPQYLGLALIGCGILALLISVYQYWWSVRYLWSDLFAPIAGVKKEGMHTPVLAVAAVLMCIGLSAFFAVLLRLM